METKDICFCLQEVSIMKKVRHKNVVQFIGACTQKPNLCIVFEFMPCGSLYDHLKSDGPPRLSQLLKAATEICKGMDYLHKRQIIHRDLKAANLLTDETGGLKIADFGVARMLTSAGVMTAETGTYRCAWNIVQYKLLKYQILKGESVAKEELVVGQNNRLHANFSVTGRICCKRHFLKE